MGDSTISVPDRVRTACARVAGLARSVAIEESVVGSYAAALGGLARIPVAYSPFARISATATASSRTAFVLCLDAINFGSGWWPTIRKRPGCSGYSTIEAGLTERFRAEEGAWSAGELTRFTAVDIAQVTGQDPAHPLMEQYASVLRDVGERVLAEHAGSFEAVVEAAGGSAVRLAGLLAGWEAFADASVYDGQPVPFFKRAQIAAADIDRFGVAKLRDTERLTAFADNLVPHVLRVDGVLRLDPALEKTIDGESHTRPRLPRGGRAARLHRACDRAALRGHGWPALAGADRRERSGIAAPSLATSRAPVRAAAIPLISSSAHPGRGGASCTFREHPLSLAIDVTRKS